jgi:Tfp pilus assembly protein PilV
MTRKVQSAAATPTPNKYARITGTKAVVLWGALAFLLCGLFPPWLYNASGRFRARSAGYGFILANGDSAPGDVIDVNRRGVEWLCVLAATGVAWFFLSGETVPTPVAPPASALPPLSAAGKRKPFFSTKKWILFGTISALLVFVIALLLVAMDQAQTIKQARAKAETDAQLQQEREQQWQEFAAQETKKRQNAESIVKEFNEEQNQKRMQQAESIAQAQETERRQKAASIEREKAKWNSLLTGMIPQQVQNILGRPDGVIDYGLGLGTWDYNHFGVGYVTFKDGVVNGWSAPVAYY